MQTVRFVYWQEGALWLGYLEEFPDYMSQGETLDELKDNLKEIYTDATGGLIPGARRVSEFQIA